MRLWIVHARGEEQAAELLAEPLRAAGYDVGHDGTILVGESLMGAAASAIVRGDPIVLCGTVRAAGSTWSEQVINAARADGGPVRVFVVRMEADANLRQLAVDGKVADFSRNPDAAIRALLVSLREHFPPDRPTRTAGGPIFTAPGLSGSEVHRPELLEPLVERLCTPPSRADPGAGGKPMSAGLDHSAVTTVGIAGLEGAGGFGKTTLAAVACHDWRVKRRFPDGVVWVTVGQNIRGPALANRINEVSELLCGRRPTFTDAEAAGQHLGTLLGDSDSLLVIDDVWHHDQLAPFLVGGQSCVRLVTTRIRNILPPGGSAVLVDAMPADQARRLLVEGLPQPTDAVDSSGLVRITGGWPVLIALVNRALHRRIRYGADLQDAVRAVELEIAADGPAVLDITNSARRQDAVTATVRASENLLADVDTAWVKRYHELAVFPDDTDIPVTTAAALWRGTGGVTPKQAEQLCFELADLCMINLQFAGPRPSFRIHDVVHAYLRHTAGDGLADLHVALVDVHRRGLPAERGRTCWWHMPASEPYLWDHLVLHLANGGAASELTELVHDLRWAAVRIYVGGAANVEADLAFLPDDTTARRLGSLVQQTSHLYRSQDSLPTIQATLAAYAVGVPLLTGAAGALQYQIDGAHLAPVQQMSDQPDPALFRSISGHVNNLSAMAVGPSVTWLATGDDAGSVRVWDPRSGIPRAVFSGHTDRVTAVAVTSQGSWIVSASSDRTVRVWDLHTGGCRAVMEGHTDHIDALVIAPDTSWLASASHDGTVRIWDPENARCRAVLDAYGLGANELVVAPDGSWLASASRYRRVIRIWDPTTGSCVATLSGHSDGVNQLAVGSGLRLASAGKDGSVRIWQPPSEISELVLDAHESGTRAITFSADGQCIITAGGDGSVKVWNVPSGRNRAILPQRVLGITTLVAAPDGSWFASGGTDGTVRVWHQPSMNVCGVFGAHPLGVDFLGLGADGAWLASGSDTETILRVWKPTVSAAVSSSSEVMLGVQAMAMTQDGTRFATGDRGGRLRIWNHGSITPEHIAAAHTSEIQALAIAPGGAWLVTGDRYGQMRIWDTAKGLPTTSLNAYGSPARPSNAAGPLVFAVAQDGAWLASGSADGIVRIWDPSTGSLLHALTEGAVPSERTKRNGAKRVRGLAAAPNGSWLAGAGGDGLVRIWDPTTGKLLCTLQSARESPLRSSRLRLGLSIPEDLVGAGLRARAMAVAPDSSWLATGDADGKIRIWDPLNGTIRLTIEAGSSEVSVLAVGPSGSWLAAGGRDGGIHMWDRATGSQLAESSVHEGRIHALAVFADGARLASAGDDGMMHVLDVKRNVSVAMLRTDSRLRFCAWDDSEDRLIFAGNRGLYMTRLVESNRRLDREY